MDFVMSLPRGNNAIWVIVDRLTKSTHFIPFRIRQSTEALAEKYMQEIVRQYGVPVSTVLDRDTRFVSHFWGSLQRSLGSKLIFSTTFHPQTDGQSERTIYRSQRICSELIYWTLRDHRMTICICGVCLQEQLSGQHSHGSI